MKKNLTRKNKDLENKLFTKFKETIKNINEIYNSNKNIYNQLIGAINKDSKEEKIKRIESEYKSKISKEIKMYIMKI